MDTLDYKLAYLGYKKGKESYKLTKDYELIFNLLSKISTNDLKKMESISLDEIKKEAVEFYSKYFNLHDVRNMLFSDVESVMQKIARGELDGLKAYREYFNLTKEVNPFDIPIELTEGHSMVGEVRKDIMVIPVEYVPEDTGIFIPFTKIKLGNELDKLSPATYIHEIAHTQTESHPGYTESFLNREVISIFLEKLSAMELDHSLELLKRSERKRFEDLAHNINNIKMNGKFINLTSEEELKTYSYIRSTLLAEKLFDLYLNERKQKNKDKYISDIQDIFDGKITVEELLLKHNVTVNNSKDINLIIKHIK